MPTPPANVPGPKPGGRLRRLIDGPTISDPLYLTNRSLTQRVRLAALIALPVLVVGGLVAYALSNRATKNAPPPAEVTAAEIAKAMPDLNKEIHVAVNNDIEVIEVSVKRGGDPQVIGTIKNNGERRYPYAKVSFDLVDAGNSQVGAVAHVFDNVGPHSSIPFHFSIQQKDADKALVRDIRTDKDN
jgi:hypothetical protein